MGRHHTQLDSSAGCQYFVLVCVSKNKRRAIFSYFLVVTGRLCNLKLDFMEWYFWCFLPPSLLTPISKEMAWNNNELGLPKRSYMCTKSSSGASIICTLFERKIRQPWVLRFPQHTKHLFSCVITPDLKTFLHLFINT